MLWPIRFVRRLVVRFRKWREQREHDRIVRKYESVPFIKEMRRPITDEKALEALERLREESERGGYVLPKNLRDMREELEEVVKNRPNGRRDDLHGKLKNPKQAKIIIWGDDPIELID
jgi:hypothetical protein